MDLPSGIINRTLIDHLLLAVAIITSQGKLSNPVLSVNLLAFIFESSLIVESTFVPFDSIVERIEFAVEDM